MHKHAALNTHTIIDIAAGDALEIGLNRVNLIPLV